MTQPPVVYVSPARLRVLAELVFDGCTNRVIARRLGISEWTVKTHLARLYAATGTQDRASLAVAVLRKRVLITTEKPRRAAA